MATNGKNQRRVSLNLIETLFWQVFKNSDRKSQKLSPQENWKKNLDSLTTPIKCWGLHSAMEYMIKCQKNTSATYFIDLVVLQDVVFSATYRQSQVVPYKDAQVLVPPCKCDSHKETTRGELTAKQPGVYTLIFDNTYSKMTSKRVNYALFSSRSAMDT